jgi:TM2 domain-containing membrane protein YozV/Tfp pilus assembly protein PilE
MTNNMIACRGCGKEIHKTAATCPHCGAPQRTGRYKSRIAAGVIAIFVGGLGIHRFYLGQWWGIFYLLFFWTWIPGLIALIEGIVFLATNNEKWDKKYNEGIPGQGEGGPWLVVAIVFSAFIFIAIIGILAAIAIPQYHDYTIRARVMGAMATGNEAQQRVEQYVLDKKSWPENNADIALPEKPNDKFIEALSVGSGGAITIHLSRETGLMEKKTIVLTPHVDSGELIWSCDGGTLEDKYRPRQCRQDGVR